MCKKVFLILMQDVNETFLMKKKEDKEEKLTVNEERRNPFRNLSTLLVRVTCGAETHRCAVISMCRYLVMYSE